MELNKEILRWVILIGATPLWWPFLKMLWNDFNDALRTDGGLFGSAPGPRQLEQIEREKLSQPETLISEPWVRPGEHRTPRLRNDNARATRNPDGRAPGGRAARGPNERKRGFR